MAFLDKTPHYSPSRHSPTPMSSSGTTSRLAEYPHHYRPPQGTPNTPSTTSKGSALDTRHSTFKVQHGEAVLDRVGILPTQCALHQQRERQTGAMRETSFVLGPASTAATAQEQRAIQVLQQQQQQRSTSAMSSLMAVQMAKAAASESSVYVSGGVPPQEHWSTMSRASYKSGVADRVSSSPSEHAPSDAERRAAVRDAQRQTHMVFAQPTKWQSESRGCYQPPNTNTTPPTPSTLSSSTLHGNNGAPLNRRDAQRQQTESHLQLGFSSVDVKDTLRSHKQVDYSISRPGLLGVQNTASKRPETPAAATVSVVLGYDDKKSAAAAAAGQQRRPSSSIDGLSSTYGVSYTPVTFR